jgi:hypothetical protein
MVWPLDLKKSKKDCRISTEVIPMQISVCTGKFKGFLLERIL